MNLNDADTRQKIKGADGIEYLRQPCEIITRVMGYFRPVSHYNNGKKSEFYSRKSFSQEKAANKIFIEQYAAA